MNDYILEYFTGSRENHYTAKAGNINILRSRIIKDRTLMKEEMVKIMSGSQSKSGKDVSYRYAGTMWYDGYNRKYMWMDNKGKVSSVSQGGYLTEFEG